MHSSCNHLVFHPSPQLLRHYVYIPVYIYIYTMCIYICIYLRGRPPPWRYIMWSDWFQRFLHSLEVSSSRNVLYRMECPHCFNVGNNFGSFFVNLAPFFGSLLIYFRTISVPSEYLWTIWNAFWTTSEQGPNPKTSNKSPGTIFLKMRCPLPWMPQRDNS